MTPSHDEVHKELERRIERADNEIIDIYGLLHTIDTKVDGLERRLTVRLDGMDRRFDAVDTRLDGIDGRLDGIDGRLDGIDGRLDGIDGTLVGLTASIAEVLRRLPEAC